MCGTRRPARGPPGPARRHESGHVAIVGAIVVAFLGLMLGIWAGFAGRPWGRYVAWAAFAVLCLLATGSERIGWRKVGRRRGRPRLLRIRRSARRSPHAPPPVVTTPYRDRLRIRPVDLLEQAGSWFLGVVVVVVLLGGTVWVLGFLIHR